MTTNTTCISSHLLCNIVNAFAYSEQADLPLTAFATIAWTKTTDWRDDLLAERRSQLFWNMTKWMRKRNIPAAYLWTMENSRVLHLHMNLAMHIPRKHFKEFIDDFPLLVPGYDSNPHAVVLTSDNGGSRPKWFFTTSQRIGILKYFLKGMDHKAPLIAEDGTTENLGAFIGIQHRGHQGIVPGKRAGVSHALGPKSRIAAGYIDRTDPDGLRSILSPQQLVTADAA